MWFLYTVHYVNYVDCGTVVAAFKNPKSGLGILQSSRFLFRMVLTMHKRVYRKELLKWVSAQFKCPVNVPAFGFTKVSQLLVCGKYEVALPMLF